MPMYDWMCKECKTYHEEDVKLVDIDEGTTCPACGGECKRVILRAPPVHLKGGGWSDDGYSNLLGNHKDFNKENFSQNDLNLDD